MPNKKRIIKDNVVMFPGTVERLKQQAHQHAENYEYAKAAATFEEVLNYEEGDEHLLSAYAFSLFEVKRFEEARALCEELFAKGTDLYIEVMELYLSTCMELRDFQHVETMISQLLRENVIPPQQIEQFEHIRRLNHRLAKSTREKEDQLHEQTMQQQQSEALDSFFERSFFEQMQLLKSLQQANSRPFAEQLKAIIEHDNSHPMIQAIALYILVEQQIALEINVAKFGVQKVIRTTDLDLPEQMPIVEQIINLLEEAFHQDASSLELVTELVSRHLLIMYPFSWLDYDAKEVAEGYVAYIHRLFGQPTNGNEDVLTFIEQLEKFSVLPEA